MVDGRTSDWWPWAARVVGPQPCMHTGHTQKLKTAQHHQRGAPSLRRSQKSAKHSALQSLQSSSCWRSLVCPFCARLAVRNDCLALLLCARGAALHRLSPAPHSDALRPTSPAPHAFCCAIVVRSGLRLPGRPCQAYAPCRSATATTHSCRSRRRSRLLLTGATQKCRAWLFSTWTRACGCQRCTSWTTRPANGTRKRRACALASRCARPPLLSPSSTFSHRWFSPPDCAPLPGGPPRVQGAGRGAPAAQHKGGVRLQHNKAVLCGRCDAGVPPA